MPNVVGVVLTLLNRADFESHARICIFLVTVLGSESLLWLKIPVLKDDR